MADQHHQNHIRQLENRVEQLEDLRNVTTNADFYEKLAAGKPASTGSASPAGLQYIPVPITLKAQLGSPTALAIGAFATTLTTLSLALMGFRGVSVTNAFIGDFFGVAGIGMVVAAQWEIILGNTYAFTVLSAFGLFYAGFGFIITPSFGVAASYEGGAMSPEYNNAVGFFVLSKSTPTTRITTNTDFAHSVGRPKHLLPNRLPPTQSRLHWHLLHRRNGFHASRSLLLPHRRRQSGPGQRCQDFCWGFCVCGGDAGVLYYGQSDVSGGAEIQFPDGGYESLFPEVFEWEG